MIEKIITCDLCNKKAKWVKKFLPYTSKDAFYCKKHAKQDPWYKEIFLPYFSWTRLQRKRNSL